MIFQGVDVSGSFDITGSFIAPKGAAFPLTASSVQGDMFFHTTFDTLYVFTNSGSWTPIGDITSSSPPPPAEATIEYLAIAGGGGGSAGFGNGNGTGGGGAGGMLSSSLSSIASGSVITVTIGAGGSGGTGTNYSNRGSTNRGADGTNSSIASTSGTSFSTITCTGGGSGGRGSADQAGNDGGSGGGGGAYSGAGGSGTTGQGNDGGTGTPSGNTNYRGGGGGGKSAAGATGTASGNGGAGLASVITGTSTTYAGGGGGGCYAGKTPGSAGTGGGGAGSAGSSTPGSGTANTGGGGGGSGWPGSSSSTGANGGAGGAGVVILAYPSASVNSAGGIIGDAGNGRKYNQFNSSGTLKVGSTSDFQIITSNLVSHFDAGDFASRGTSTWTDLSGNGNNLTAYSSPSLGGNFYYDFATSYFSKSDSNHNFADNNFTVEIWVKWDSLSSGDTIASKRGTGSPGTRNWLFGNDSTGVVYFLQYHNSSNYTYPQTASGTVTTGTWYHLVATGDSSNIKVYVDTTEEASASFTASGIKDTTTPLEIGRRGTNSGYQYLDGQVAQFRAYSSALTPAQISQNYNATKTNFV